MSTEILTPTVRVNEFGVRAFTPLLSGEVTGHTVIVRDWYGAETLDVIGVETGRNGYPSALKFTRKDGRLGLFSLHTAREIEVLP